VTRQAAASSHARATSSRPDCPGIHEFEHELRQAFRRPRCTANVHSRDFFVGCRAGSDQLVQTMQSGMTRELPKAHIRVVGSTSSCPSAIDFLRTRSALRGYEGRGRPHVERNSRSESCRGRRDTGLAEALAPHDSVSPSRARVAWCREETFRDASPSVRASGRPAQR